MGINGRHDREAVVTKAGTRALLVLLVCSLFPAALQGQAGEQQVVLVRTNTGFVAAHPDGTQSTTKYVVPEGQELCLTDIIWALNGPPNSTLTVVLINSNVDGTSSWRMWAVTATMSAIRDASGQSSFQSGPKIARGSEIVAVFPLELSGAAFTIYGKQRASSTGLCS